jgi:hypothetical protein
LAAVGDSDEVSRITTTIADGSNTVQRDVSIEFNGTSQVPVTVGEDAFTLDVSRRMGRGRHVRRVRRDG